MTLCKTNVTVHIISIRWGGGMHSPIRVCVCVCVSCVYMCVCACVYMCANVCVCECLVSVWEVLWKCHFLTTLKRSGGDDIMCMFPNRYVCMFIQRLRCYCIDNALVYSMHIRIIIFQQINIDQWNRLWCVHIEVCRGNRVPQWYFNYSEVGSLNPQSILWTCLTVLFCFCFYMCFYVRVFVSWCRLYDLSSVFLTCCCFFDLNDSFVCARTTIEISATIGEMWSFACLF